MNPTAGGSKPRWAAILPAVVAVVALVVVLVVALRPGDDPAPLDADVGG